MTKCGRRERAHTRGKNTRKARIDLWVNWGYCCSFVSIMAARLESCFSALPEEGDVILPFKYFHYSQSMLRENTFSLVVFFFFENTPWSYTFFCVWRKDCTFLWVFQSLYLQFPAFSQHQNLPPAPTPQYIGHSIVYFYLKVPSYGEEGGRWCWCTRTHTWHSKKQEQKGCGNTAIEKMLRTSKCFSTGKVQREKKLSSIYH